MMQHSHIKDSSDRVRTGKTIKTTGAAATNNVRVKPFKNDADHYDNEVEEEEEEGEYGHRLFVDDRIMRAKMMKHKN